MLHRTVVAVAAGGARSGLGIHARLVVGSTMQSAAPVISTGVVAVGVPELLASSAPAVRHLHTVSAWRCAPTSGSADGNGSNDKNANAATAGAAEEAASEAEGDGGQKRRSALSFLEEESSAAAEPSGPDMFHEAFAYDSPIKPFTPPRPTLTEVPTARTHLTQVFGGKLPAKQPTPEEVANMFKDPKYNPVDIQQAFPRDSFWPEEKVVKPAPLWRIVQGDREVEKKVTHQQEFVRRKVPQLTFIKAPEVDEFGRSYGTGRRKTAAARVWIKPGNGSLMVNGKQFVDYFERSSLRVHVLEPLTIARATGYFDVWATVKGGGLSGQAGAVRHGLAKALVRYDPFLRGPLKVEKMLKRDPRMVERKKPGQKKARRKFQWVKR